MSERRADRLACLAAIVLLAASVHGLAGAIASEPWVRYALRLETVSEPRAMPDAIRSQLGAELAGSEAARCDFDLPEGRVTVAMDLLRRSLADPPGSPERTGAERTAQRAVREAIGCNAADGNLWYLLALLDQRGGAPWDRIEELVLLSAALSPYEADTLAKRARLVSYQLTRDGIAPSLDVEADLRRAIANVRVESAAAVLSGLRDGGQGALADELVAGLPEKRLAALEAGTSWRRSTFGRPERYRHYEFRPFAEPER